MRILKESGRDTAQPIFVVGAFSGTRKLGEGPGSSLAMARQRAQADALRRIYLTRSFADSQESDGGSSLLLYAHSDGSNPSLPSDTLVSPGQPYTPIRLGDESVEANSSGKTGWLAKEVGASPFREDSQPIPKNKKIARGPYKLKKLPPT